MKKNFIYSIILLFLMTLLWGCKGEKGVQVSSFTQKYLDFYNQKNNVVIAIRFKDKDFIPEEVWNQTLVLDIQEKIEEKFEKVDNYAYIIPIEDIPYYEIVSWDKNLEKYVVRFSGSLKKNEAIIVKSYDSSVPSIKIKKDNKESDDFWDGIVIWAGILEGNLDIKYDVLSWPREFSEEKEQTVLNKKNRDTDTYEPAYAEGEIDLDGDGKKEKITFRGDKEIFGDSVKYDIESGSLTIDDKTFLTRDLLKLVEFTADEDFYSPVPIYNIEIIDINPKDSFKEIVLVLDYWEDGDLGLLFHYINGEFKFIGKVPYGMESYLSSCLDHKTNTLTVRDYNYDLGFSYHHKKFYTLENEKINVKVEDEEIMDYFGRITGIVALPINIYKSSNSDELLFQAEKDRVLLFLETDHKTWIKVKDLETGQIGYIRFSLDYSEGYSRIIFHQQKELEEYNFYDVIYNLPAYG